MESYELAFRMQAEVPDIVRLDREDAHTLAMYGIGEAATDGSHPSDLGMVRYADGYERALRRIL